LSTAIFAGKIAAMIKKISVTNFKNHKQTEFELGSVVALVGPNGCGKTSLLLAIQTLNRLAKQIVLDGNFNFEFINNLIRKGSQQVGISIEGEQPQWKIALTIPAGSGGAFGQDFEFEAEKWSSEQSSPIQFNRELNLLALQAFGQVAYFKAIAQNVSLPSYSPEIPPKLGADGTNTASVISDLKTSQEEIYEWIEDDLKKIVPLVKRIRVHSVPKLIKEKRTISANGNSLVYDEDRQVNAQELIFDTQSGDRLPANMVSEGTLVTLALLTLLHTSGASLFLLDDIEQGLHPLAQRQLMKTLKNFAENHNKQIILTSHSPYIVDELEAKDVWVMATDGEGISHCKRLSEHPDAKRLLEVLTTGEFGGAVGEDWVIPNESLAEVVNA
jgi:predicted ATPase